MQKTTSFTTNKSFADIQKSVNDLVQTVKGWLLHSADEQSMKIALSVNPSTRSFGEDVEITFQPIDAKSGTVTVTSKPSLSITKVDYGKNQKNLEIVQTFITSDDPATRTAILKEPTKHLPIIIATILGIIFLVLVVYALSRISY